MREETPSDSDDPKSSGVPKEKTPTSEGVYFDAERVFRDYGLHGDWRNFRMIVNELSKKVAEHLLALKKKSHNQSVPFTFLCDLLDCIFADREYSSYKWVKDFEQDCVPQKHLVYWRNYLSEEDKKKILIFTIFNVTENDPQIGENLLKLVFDQIIDG